MARGYRAMKFDPFGTAWQDLTGDEMESAVESVAKVREAVGRGRRADDRISRPAVGRQRRSS